MPVVQVNPGYQVAGRNFGQSKQVNVNSAVLLEPPDEIPAAKSGSLTTRTDDDTGVVTLSTGHGITTGARVDAYWEVGGVKGYRYGMAATVAGDAVTVDGGAGDNLPVATSTVILAVAQEFDFDLTGDNVKVLAFFSEVRGLFVLEDDIGGVLYVKHHPDSNQASGWYSDSGETNPIAGDTVAKAFMSHNSTSDVRTMRIGAGID